MLSVVGDDYPIEVTEAALDSAEGQAAQRAWRAPFPPLLLINERLFGFGRISERKLRRALDELGA